MSPRPERKRSPEEVLAEVAVCDRLTTAWEAESSVIHDPAESERIGWAIRELTTRRDTLVPPDNGAPKEE
jgi:hypothetical protein